MFEQAISKEIFEKKYCIHGESSVEEVFRGVAKEIASCENDPHTWQDVFYKEMIEGKFLPAGRILANARPDSPMKNYMNCYVIPIEDSMEGIYTALRNDALIGKMGGGVGFNLSNLRPKNASISKGGESSGPMSFLDIFDVSAKAIHTGGARRSAHICIMNIDHPDIEEFITYKRGDSNKKLTQFNISVGITDAFMVAVEHDEDWDLQFGGKVYKTVKAKYLYDLITENMYQHNEPGVFFLDTVNENNSGSYMYDINSPNPCVTGDTIVAVADGRNGVSIKQLAEEKVSFPVYSAKISGRSAGWKAEIKNAVAFKTGEKEVIEIFLSDDSSFKCTPDHLLALSDRSYVMAKDTIGLQLERFYSFSNKNSNSSYRTINSVTNGFARQYRMIYEYYYGEYKDKNLNVHHIDNDSKNDFITNLKIIDRKKHQKMSNEEKLGANNPVWKVDKEKRSIIQRHRNVLGNAKRYNWEQERIDREIAKLPEIPKLVDNNIILDNNLYVVDIRYTKEVVPVYDLTVEDNHNFYIITKTDDDRFLNSSGVLVHNCGEQPLPDFGCCCLGALNLSAFVKNPFTDEAIFDTYEFAQSVHHAVRFLDNVLSTSDYPIPEVREQVLSERRIGLGFTALADTFTMMGMVYGDDDSMDLSHHIGKTLRDESYLASTVLAKEKGTFPNCKHEILECGFVSKLPEYIKDKISKYGLRNIALNTIAPTGTTSLSIGNNCSSGIEPVFALEYTRNVKQPDDSFIGQQVYSRTYLMWKKLFGDKELPESFITADRIPIEDSVKIQEVFQEYIDASISKTLTLPNEFTFEQYQRLLMDAWNKGLKGITTFNPNGSLAPILSVEKTTKKATNTIAKRDKTVPCDIHELTVNKQKFIVLVGIKDDEPYEVFLTKNNELLNVEKCKKGSVVKIGKGNYKLIMNNGTVIDDFTKLLDDDYAIMCRHFSLELRHGIDLRFIVDQLNKTSRFNTFSKAMAQVLKKYIKDNEEVLTEGNCPECDGKLVYKEGCVTCSSCGYSKC